MLSQNSKNDVLQDMILLYELALQTGKTIDFKQNIENFLKLLISRKSLSSANIWLKGLTIKEASISLLPSYIEADDWVRTIQFPIKDINKKQTEFVEHFINRAQGEEVKSFSVKQEYLINNTNTVKEGTYLLYQLDNFGCMMLYSCVIDDTRIGDRATKKLRVVFDRFKVSVIASLNQLKLENEVNKTKAMSDEIMMLSKFPLQSPYPVLRFTDNVELLFLNSAAEKIADHFKELQWVYSKMFSESLSTNSIKVYEQVIEGRYYTLTVKPIPEYGYVNIYGMDITIRKSIENKLKEEKEKAEKLAEVKMEFLSTMSHEIRTPMNSIIGSINLLIDTALDTYQSKKLEMMRFAADNLLRLINEILDFNKLEAHKVNLEKIRFSLPETLENIFSMHSDNAEQKNIAFDLIFNKTPINFIIGDPTRLSQILLNLLSNAIKFTEKGGVELSVQSTFNNQKTIVYQFIIKDSGIGISDDRISAIFEAFTQADNSTTRKFGGTGLGLSITKKLVDLLEGSMEVNSKVGKGTEFIVTIPFDIAADQESITKKKAELNEISGNLKDKKVLLVDDNEFNILIAKEFLGRWEAETIVAKNGQEAIEALTTGALDFDIILMDLQMPIMDGFEATLLLRNMQSEYFQNIPIIALTADVASDEIRNLKRKGFNDFASKPFDPDILLQKLLQLIYKK
ncbi:response regulator [Flammeovirga pectinis]|uniref:histidine kinase n=1 Tax=Flammeovirga pectinis TaxID=2494373 RepID=A0A3Q9FLV9_9BACT|nr:ATP-binding protein [Flammeovirga pectinis]AZQ62684.1 response regulator [Flammeovirga pectinis]